MGIFSKNKTELEAVQENARKDSDTLKLWESYKNSAFIWRSFTLIQMPATAVLIALSMYFFVTADTVLNIPLSPEPGSYSAKKLPDSLFVSQAINVSNLISTYQPYTARKQYKIARRYLWEPALSKFEKLYVETDLEAIEETSRSQIFYIDKRRVRVERRGKKIIVRLPGTRQKFIHNTSLDPEQVVWQFEMITIPRNVHNEYGIVIVGIELQGVKNELEVESKSDTTGATEAPVKAKKS